MNANTDVASRWPEQLAGRLFAIPPRWGWQAAVAPVPVPPAPAPVGQRPVWVAPPAPDTSALHAARSKAVSKVIRRVAFIVIVGFAIVAYRLTIENTVQQQDDSTQRVIWIALGVVAMLMVIGILRAIAAVGRASRAIQRFEQPYRAFQAAERQRYEQVAAGWDAAVRRHNAETAEAARQAAQRANGPLWFPVHPASQPTRVDVFGGDPRRNGWASLLVTLGTSLLAAGHRITVLDLTGQDVGGGLARVAQAHGLPTSRLDIADGSDAFLLDGVPARDIPECLAYAVTGQSEKSDLRQERALVTEMLGRVLGCLDGNPSFARLAAGIRVLRQGTGDGLLADSEISRLAGHIGEVDQNEWTGRQLRFLASQLDSLHLVAPFTGSVRPLWTDQAVCLVTTQGRRDDRKELVDRLLVQVSQAAIENGRLGRFLVLAGADHLGAQVLTTLSDHARRVGVRLVLMIDQPQGDLEKTAGTGGAVCIMKMYNHRDATIAAEFVGKNYKFVVNQVTRQVGKTFTDGGGDSFAANTGHSDSTRQRMFGSRNDLSDSRGHAWTGTRNWSSSDNVGNSTSSSRVYEFVVDPQEILGMPETAFILVDNTDQGRRVAMADGNPGISLLPRVATTPA